jgi:colicin import membrane protein
VGEPRYSFPLTVSVILHVVVLFILIVSFEFSSLMPVVQNSDEDMKVISATIINPRATVPVPAPTPVAEAPVPAAPPKPVPAPAKPIFQETDVEEQMIAIDQQLKKRLVDQQQAHTKKLMQEKRKLLAKEKKLKQAALLKAMEKEMHQQTEKSLQQQVLNEQQRVVGVKVQGEVNKYKALILQAIAQRWLVPAGVDKTLSSELFIRLAPGGTVLDVQVTKSSGDLALDRSARDAVFKASPLPVPEDDDGFNQFRQFILKVKPQNLIESDT